MSDSSFKDIVMRIFITILGIAFILWGIGTFALGIVGESSPAVITTVRRQGGERADGKAGRYTYIISYTFKGPDGKTIDGYSTRIGSGVYVKHPNTTTSVRYLKAWPFLNTLEDETKPGPGQLVLIAVGIFLIYAMNGRKKKRRPRVQSRRRY